MDYLELVGLVVNANSRAISKKKKSFEINITDILRKERKWNHIKCSIKTIKPKPQRTRAETYREQS